MQMKIASQLAVAHGACLDYILLGVQIIPGLGFFVHSSCLGDSEDCDFLL